MTIENVLKHSVESLVLAAFLEINFVQDVRSDALALCRAL
jgi:hypothetical protein